MCIGGSSSASDINDVSDSMKKQWEIDAKTWNDFIVRYEPRMDYATEQLLSDKTDTIKGAVRGSLFDTYEKQGAENKTDTGAILRSSGNLGSALAMGNVEATEKGKDYAVANINTALGVLHGEKAANMQSLEATTQQALNTALTKADTNAQLGQIQSANIGTAATAVASTATNWGKK